MNQRPNLVSKTIDRIHIRRIIQSATKEKSRHFSQLSWMLVGIKKDLVKAMQKEAKYLTTVGISETPIEGINLDTNIYLSETVPSLEEDFLAVCSVLPGQILGFYKSLNLGLKPDAPSVSGTIARVVEGVTIYDHQDYEQVSLIQF